MDYKQSFQVFDIAIALTSSPNKTSQERVKGGIYIVLDVAYCPNCGVQVINIGGVSNYETFTCACKRKCNNGGLAYTLSSLFVGVDKIDQVIEDSIESEDYETCALFRDIKTSLNF